MLWDNTNNTMCTLYLCY